MLRRLFTIFHCVIPRIEEEVVDNKSTHHTAVNWHALTGTNCFASRGLNPYLPPDSRKWTYHGETLEKTWKMTALARLDVPYYASWGSILGLRRWYGSTPKPKRSRTGTVLLLEWTRYARRRRRPNQAKGFYNVHVQHHMCLAFPIRCQCSPLDRVRVLDSSAVQLASSGREALEGLVDLCTVTPREQQFMSWTDSTVLEGVPNVYLDMTYFFRGIVSRK